MADKLHTDNLPRGGVLQERRIRACAMPDAGASVVELRKMDRMDGLM